MGLHDLESLQGEAVLVFSSFSGPDHGLVPSELHFRGVLCHANRSAVVVNDVSCYAFLYLWSRKKEREKEGEKEKGRMEGWKEGRREGRRKEGKGKCLV